MTMKGIFLWAFASLAALARVSAGVTGGIGDVRLSGEFGARLDRMIERHVGGTDVDYITACFQNKTERRGWWQTEFWGKYMHSAVPYAVYGDSSKIRADIERGIDRVLSAQEPCGYIGNYPDELRCGEGWDVWGMKYTMMGLLHYFDGTKDPESGIGNRERGEKALAACQKLCDYLIAEIGPNGRRGRELWQTGNWSGFASSSVLEPVVWLYRRTGERKYLDFADYIVRGMSEPAAGPRLVDLALKGISVADRNGFGNNAETHGGYVMKHNRWKAYEMMSCYQGILDYVEEKVKVAGESEQLGNLRLAAIKTAEDIVKTEVNLAGGCACSEAWFHGARKQHLPYVRLQETCVTTTWMRFCGKLLEVTGDPKWADELEKTFYNAYLAAMKPDGSAFAGYTPLSGYRSHGQHHCGMTIDCCTANGPRGFLCFLKELFRIGNDGARVNFYASAQMKGTMPGTGARVAFEMETDYPSNGCIRIVSQTDATAGEVPLRFRIPSWCAQATVKLNGRPLDGVTSGKYFPVSRVWNRGDTVEILFEMPVVAHNREHHVAFTRGPLLLARDSRFSDEDLCEPFQRGYKDGQVVGGFSEAMAPSRTIWLAYSATLPVGAHSENPEEAKPVRIFFCDYASAGNAWNRGSYYRTWFPFEWGPQE